MRIHKNAGPQNLNSAKRMENKQISVSGKDMRTLSAYGEG